MNQLRSLYEELIQHRPDTSNPEVYKKRIEENVFELLAGLGLDYENMFGRSFDTIAITMCRIVQ